MYETIRKEVARQNISFLELSQKSNVPVQTIKDALNHNELIQPNYIYRLEQALNIR